MDTSKIEKCINNFRNELVQILKQKDVPNHGSEFLDFLDTARLKCWINDQIKNTEDSMIKDCNNYSYLYWEGYIDAFEKVLEVINTGKFRRKKE